jgi:ABC-type multidrug transport system ATPase subunit
MVTHLIQRVGLVKYAHVACGTLSGGNKRKLALAAALVGAYAK